ncbi:hypothetical protein G4177_12945 [Corallococcus sp. ZKHCc1 1396]|uniref:JmjC domain-containing protein n=2 Tax=Corallococcus soli TaxID=2710757 RepID=A0ABR9PMG5_9BACT|nr:hypothetical protein [Corallococcus soli]
MTGAVMSREPDWESFVRRHWEKAPAHLSLDVPVVSPEQVFRSLVAVCAPFRFGTRFRALPDVRLFVETAQLGAPGPLLPGEDDAGVSDYVRRASAGLGGRPFQLFVEQPFMFDFTLWDPVRRFVRGLLERVGVPVLPIVSELLLGNFPQNPRGVAKRPNHALFTLVLHGRLRVRLWEKLWGDAPGETVDFDRHHADATTLEAGEGEWLYTPSRLWHLDEARGDCMALRLWVPVQGSRPTDAVKEVLVALLEARSAHDEAVPYLPYPWRRPRKGKRTTAPPLERTADDLEALLRSPDVHQALRIIWARRVSACGLEPAPPPDKAVPLRDTDLVRGVPSADIIRMGERPGPWIWAVNGHVFPGMGTAVAQEVLKALASDEAHAVGELRRLARRGAQREELDAVLEKLQRLRALQVVTREEG